MWSQLFGLVLSPISQELGVPNERQGLASCFEDAGQKLISACSDIYVAINVGLTVGALFWVRSSVLRFDHVSLL